MQSYLKMSVVWIPSSHKFKGGRRDEKSGEGDKKTHARRGGSGTRKRRRGELENFARLFGDRSVISTSSVRSGNYQLHHKLDSKS